LDCLAANDVQGRFGDVLGTNLYDYYGGFSACVVAITVVYALILPTLLLVPKRDQVQVGGGGNTAHEADWRSRDQSSCHRMNSSVAQPLKTMKTIVEDGVPLTPMSILGAQGVLKVMLKRCG
jgi:hypothetical protein